MWTFLQSTGAIAHDGVTIAHGYAGGNIPPQYDATAKNNPARQAEHCIGPLPRGLYVIGSAVLNPILGPDSMRLYPNDANVMFGRSDFFIHGDSMAHPGEASEGCIVLPTATRLLIAASNDRELQVIT